MEATAHRPGELTLPLAVATSTQAGLGSDHLRKEFHANILSFI
jgi:hypothetical protein